MVLHRLLGNARHRGDIPVAEPPGDRRDDFPLAWTEAVYAHAPVDGPKVHISHTRPIIRRDPPVMSDTADLYLRYEADIERVIRTVCHMRRFRTEEAEDFAQEVRLRLIDPVANILGKFCGRSNIRTYLSAVVNRMVVDDQRRNRGRWRPWKEIEDKGPAAA